tara:strand:- start:2796 stop:3803 length:1008 start_codon:yes stop_codon:yes gene_type:complete
MAFLDNSGDIILDAVLTETGRQRLSEGSFSINKFGLGDDEINYGTYNLSHPSGSAYYDLEIMQTPIFEATTATVANINYGLLNITRTDLEYLPTININEKTKVGGLVKYGGMFYVAVNETTRTKLEAESNIGTNATRSGETSLPYVCFETGLDTQDIAATADNRSGYIVSTGLLDLSFVINADSRFITGIGGVDSTSTFFNDTSDNSLTSTLTMSYVYRSSASTMLDNYSTYTISACKNLVFEPDTGDDNDISAIKGPRGSFSGLNVQAAGELQTEADGTRSPKYADYGTVASSPSGLNAVYDWIDTTVYLQGSRSGATLQIPIRLIRYVSGTPS